MGSGKRYRAAVIGGSGYGGAELVRRLLLHPDVELVAGRVDRLRRRAALGRGPRPRGADRPRLRGARARRGGARAWTSSCSGCRTGCRRRRCRSSPRCPGLKVVDMSGDFRLKDAAAYERYYGHAHPCPELLAALRLRPPRAEPGARSGARGSSRRPGCFATTIELALLPLARAGLLEGVVHVQGITGSSGSGAAPVGRHPPPGPRREPPRRTSRSSTSTCPEIEETLAAAGARDLALRFVPVSAPLARGIFATAFVELPEACDAGAARRALPRGVRAASRSCACRASRLPEVAAVSGSNYAEVGVVAGPARAPGAAPSRSSPRPTTSSRAARGRQSRT